MPLDEAYRRQASLLIKVVPFVATETSFALKGGTAINLFLRDMPRLSVDIDLTYVPVGDRSSSLKEIDAAMRRIGKAIKHGVRGAHVNVSSPKGEKAITKLIVRADDAQIKISPRYCAAVSTNQLSDLYPRGWKRSLGLQKFRSSASQTCMPARSWLR